MTPNIPEKLILLTLLLLCAPMSKAQSINLVGEWHARLSDAQEQIVRLPGTLDMAGVGKPNTLKAAMEKPQLLRLTRKVNYIGPCTYVREIAIPRNMSGQPLRLAMERVLWKSSLKIDGKPVADENTSLNSPHSFVVPPLTEGKHSFEITVDNRPQLDISFSNLCHSYTDDTQTIWNGVLGDFTLSVIPEIELQKPEVYPDITTGSVTLKLPVTNRTGKKKNENITFTITEKATGRITGSLTQKHAITPGASEISAVINLDSCTLWNEFTPVLYRLDIKAGNTSATTTFGMREVASAGKSILVNGQKVFLRGTLDCCVFPLTGMPPTDRDGWIKEMQTLKDWGFNHIRFHSWCPPEAAFEVADSLGLYLQTELPVWSLKIGDDPRVAEFMNDEFINMTEAYGNHPSWIMTTCGNELQHDFNTLNSLVEKMKTRDSRRLYAATSFTFEKGHGGHAEPYDQFLVTQWTDDGWVRGQGVFESEEPSFNKNYSVSMNCTTVPLISHEIGQYAVFPDMKEIDKYTGVLDPLNFKAISNDMAGKELLDRADAYTDATCRFAKLLYKEEIERALKTPGFSGFQLLGIQDFPGQGTALVGLINAFWEVKGPVAGTEFAEFNSPLVPLAAFGKAVYTPSDTLCADILLANFSGQDITEKQIGWTLSQDNGRVRSGAVGASLVRQGEVGNVARIEVPFASFHTPAKLTLTLQVEGTAHKNHWNVWLYPQSATADKGSVTVTSDFQTAATTLRDGGKVLYLPEQSEINGIESKFLPVFWSPVHFPKQAGGMGILTDPAHPALKGFPNDGHSDWQWWRPVKNATVMNLDSIADINSGSPIDPIVTVIDNFYRNRKLGYLFEAKCGRGTVVVSSINLNVESPEMKSMLKGILDYMNSTEFTPEKEISVASLESITAAHPKIGKTSATSIYE